MAKAVLMRSANHLMNDHGSERRQNKLCAGLRAGGARGSKYASQREHVQLLEFQAQQLHHAFIGSEKALLMQTFQAR